MRPSLQQKVSPMSTNGKLYSEDLIIPQANAMDSGEVKPKVDFKSLLLNSNEEVRKKKLSESKGDLSGAKNYDEFLESLNRKTENQRTPKNTLEKDDFLKLFVAQLQNQDPLKPQDGTEMASQLAQFNSVEQMINFNKGLERVEKATQANNSTNFVNYIGKDVSVKGGRIKLTQSGIGNVNFTTPKDIVSANLEIRDSSGTVVKSKDLGQVALGSHRLGWDGVSDKGETLPVGSYTFSITGKTVTGEEIPLDITSNVKVTGVDLAASTPEFYTDLGKFKPQDIASIGQQGFQDAANQLENQEQLAQKSMQKLPEKTEENLNEPIAETEEKVITENNM